MRTEKRMKHIFIVNPVAGKQDVDKKLERVNAGLAALPDELMERDEFQIYITNAPMDACYKVREEAESGEEIRIYACGGDGTLNECVNGAAHLPNVAVTHFPCGTGNDFIKTFGKDAERFFDLAALVTGEVRPMDLIDCNGRKSISICSVGVDARVGADVHKYSHLPLIGGAGGYVISLISNYIKGLDSSVTVNAGGVSYGPKLNMLCICNGRYYGGGFNPIPDAMPDDGKMDCLVVSGVNRLTFLGAVLGYARGQYRRFPQFITRVQANEVTMEAEKREVINIDGESVRAERAVFTLESAAVNFIFPAGMEYFSGR